MVVIEDSFWTDFYNLQSTGLEYYGPREFFNNNGAWMGAAQSGYDFKHDDKYGYIRYWSDIKGDIEYIYQVSLTRYKELYYDFVYKDGLHAMKEYEDWMYKDLLGAIYREVA